MLAVERWSRERERKIEREIKEKVNILNPFETIVSFPVSPPLPHCWPHLVT
jgi:hypothetical protein